MMRWTLMLVVALGVVMGGAGARAEEAAPCAGKQGAALKACVDAIADREEGAAVDAFLRSSVAQVGDAKVTNRDAAPLKDEAVAPVVRQEQRRLMACLARASAKTPAVKTYAIDFVVRETGKVSAVKVNGDRSGDAPACVLGRMQEVAFPKVASGKTIVSWSVALK